MFNNKKSMKQGVIEDYTRLDKLSLTNDLIKQKKLDIFKNATRDCGNFFSYVNEFKIDAVSSLALEKGFGTQAFLDALKRIIETCDKFPTFKDITIMVGHCTKKTPINNIDDEKLKLEKEYKEYMRIKNHFTKLLGDEKLKSFVVWWLSNTYPGIDKEILAAMSLSKDSFEKCALFDWRDAKFTSDFSKVLEIANSKRG